VSGLFVTFEGPEGAGKSTQIKLLASKLSRDGIPHLLTREPGGTPLADQLRKILADSPDGSIDGHTELLMLLAGRAHHVANVIRPALSGNKVVICDRFSDSTQCYQGAGRGIPQDVISKINEFATGGLIPDVTFLIDVDHTVGLARLAKSERVLDRFEREQGGFHARVHSQYKKLAASEPARFVVIDGTRDKDSVAETIYRSLRERLSKD
jgi:dTMP kinase